MRTFGLIASLSVFALPVMAEDAALLIGVDRYERLGRVGNATEVLNGAESLRGAGYDVSTLANGSAADMMRLVDQFANTATDADRLVVGLSGQFVTDGDRSWLLAADTVRPSYFGLGGAVSVDSIMSVLAQAPGQAVLILGYDLNADDAIGSYLREGVGDLNIPQGVTVIYGEPNATDEVIREAITVAGADVLGFARNVRWLDAVGFLPDSLIMEPANASGSTPNPPSDGTLQYWTDAQVADTADGYRRFVLNYPDSPYVAEARRRLDAIESDPVRLAESAETQLALNRNQRRDIQRDLTLLNYDTRGVDGIFGSGSRSAIRNWQQNNGFTQTSYLTAEQISRIDAQASRREAEVAAEQERAREEAERLDRAYWDETGARGDLAGYRAYLNRYPDGIFSAEAKAAVDQQDNQNNAAQAGEDALNINPVLARLIESRLNQLGFNPGAVDGRFDSDTRGAISRYQTRSGLSATGYLNQPTLARLLADTFGR